MLIAATADIHYPEYKDLFLKSLARLKNPDIILLAGDICAPGVPNAWYAVLNYLKRFNCQVVAVPGNTEFDKYIGLIKNICEKHAIFLNDQSCELHVGKEKVTIIGSRGVLDQPTSWQLLHLADIKETYQERAKKLIKNIKAATGNVKILLTHYAPTFATLHGEPEDIFLQLGTKKFEEILHPAFLTMAIHGHAHHGTRFANINDVPVYNVSLPLNKSIIEIEI